MFRKESHSLPEVFKPQGLVFDDEDSRDSGFESPCSDSEVHSLPTIQGRHEDLKSVSLQTVSQLLDGKYNDVISSYQIIDCRYPYEYEGGHIKGAENLHNQALITGLLTGLKQSGPNERNILIFHCEFSSERSPKLLRHLRSLDRKVNSDRYPFLFYSEVYLSDGGYKAFYEQHQVTSTDYVCRYDPDHELFNGVWFSLFVATGDIHDGHGILVGFASHPAMWERQEAWCTRFVVDTGHRAYFFSQDKRRLRDSGRLGKFWDCTCSFVDCS